MKHDKKILRKMFGKPILPNINLSRREIAIKAMNLAGKLSISGVQPKLSLALQKDELKPVETKGQFILKPQTEHFENLPENEFLCMQMATDLGIKVPPNMLIKLTDGSYAFLIKRFDRLPGNKKLQLEDFSQILEKDKYTGSYEQIGNFMKQCSDINYLQIQYLFELIVYNFIIGNADAHLKNFSILTKDGLSILSPAYDLVSSNLVIPNESEELALSLRGKKKKFKREHFIEFGNALGIIDSEVNNWVVKCVNFQSEFEKTINESYLPDNKKAQFITLIQNRLNRLKL
jgi:serine/threonine-protein kinase HipA